MLFMGHVEQENTRQFVLGTIEIYQQGIKYSWKFVLKKTTQMYPILIKTQSGIQVELFALDVCFICIGYTSRCQNDILHDVV